MGDPEKSSTLPKPPPCSRCSRKATRRLEDGVDYCTFHANAKIHDATCSICMESLTRPFRLSCGHAYHKPCIRKWIESSYTGSSVPCPVCRTDVTDADLVVIGPKLELRKKKQDPHQPIGYVEDLSGNILEIHRTEDLRTYLQQLQQLQPPAVNEQDSDDENNDDTRRQRSVVLAGDSLLYLFYRRISSSASAAGPAPGTAGTAGTAGTPGTAQAQLS